MTWNVGRKIAAAFSMALAIFVVVGVVSYFSTDQLIDASDRRRETFEILGRLDGVLASLQDVESGQRGYVITGEESYLEPYHEALRRIDEHLNDVRRRTVDESQRRRLDALEPIIRERLAVARETVETRRTKGFDPAVQLIRSGGGKAVMDAVRSGISGIKAEEEQSLRRRIEEAEVNAGRTRRTIVLGTLTALLVAALAAWLLTRNLAKPLAALTSVAERIRTGDLTAKIAVERRTDEVGLLAGAFERMTQSLLAMAGAAQRIASADLRSTITPQSPEDMLGNAFSQMVEHLRDQTRQLSAGAALLGSAASQIVASTTALAASASQSAAAVSETTTTVEEVRQTAHVSSQKAQSVADTAQRAAHIAQGGRASVNDMSKAMAGIRQQMEAIASSMVRLGERGQTIGQIIATVEDLASQSNLLAVNAAIEAAKAGEHGKGFSVVAQEVKSLAAQSRQATTEVRAILGDIQNATTTAVLATEQGSKTVESGSRQIELAGESIQALADSVTESAQAATQIAASSQQQLVGVDQVAQAMDSIRQASSQNVASARQLEAAAQNLNELGQRLKEIVDRYRL
jgi:methyl-accepting chemotaxis protein